VIWEMDVKVFIVMLILSDGHHGFRLEDMQQKTKIK